jgi:murein endopeptidase
MERYLKNKISELPDDFPTFEEMIESAKKRFDLPPEVWKPFDDAIARRAAKYKKVKRIHNFFKRFFSFRQNRKS